MWPGIHNCRTGSVIQPSIRITEWAVENGILPQHRKAAGLIVVALWAGRRARARARLIFVSIRGSTSPLRFLRVFASSREANSPQTPSPQWQSAGSQLQRADLALESTSYLHSCPFVSIRGSTSPLRFLRVFASSREANSPPPLLAAAVRRQPVAEGRSRAGKPELPAFVPIRVHSWFNVTPAFPSRLRVFASSREANSPQTPSPQRQSAGRQLQRADLTLESTSYLHSRSFVSIRGSTSPLRFPSRLRVFASSREANSPQTPSPQRQSAGRQLQRADLTLESPSYLHSRSFVSIRGSTSPLRSLRVFA